MKKFLHLLSLILALWLASPALATNLPDVSGAGSLTDNATTQGQMKTNFSKLRNALAEIPGAAADYELTINTGNITPPAGYAVFRVDTEGDAASDDLDTIAVTNCRDGHRIVLRAEDSGRVVTIKNATAANKIKTYTGGDIVLRDHMQVYLEYDAGLGSGQWRVVDVFWGDDSSALTAARAYLGLGNAATKTTGTSSGNVPLVSDANTLYPSIKSVPGGEAISTLTLSSDAVTPTKTTHAIDTEGSASTDNLATINTSNIPDGGLLLLVAAHTARDVVVKHGTGNIYLFDAADFTLDNTEKSLLLRRNGSNWYEVVRGGVTASGGSYFKASMVTSSVRALPTSGALSGTYIHYGNWTSTGNLTFEHGTRIYIKGNVSLGHNLVGAAQSNGGVSNGYAGPGGNGAGLSPGTTGVYQYGGGAGGGNGGAGGRGAFSSASNLYSSAPVGGPAHSVWGTGGSGGGCGAGSGASGQPGQPGGGGGAAILWEIDGTWTQTTGTFSALGANGTVATSTGGAGGGGAGGDIDVAAIGAINQSGGTISVAGGNGGAYTSSGVKGGGGGGGKSRLRSGSTVTVSGTHTAAGGTKGTGTDSTVAATDGSAGTTEVRQNEMPISLWMLNSAPLRPIDNVIKFEIKKELRKCS